MLLCKPSRNANTRSGALKPQSLMVHAGTKRSQFDETSEAIFMTSGYVYKTAEEAEASFLNDGSRWEVYKRWFTPEGLVSELDGGVTIFDGRWFLAVHYKYNRRLESRFWREVRADVDVLQRDRLFHEELAERRRAEVVGT